MKEMMAGQQTNPYSLQLPPDYNALMNAITTLSGPTVQRLLSDNPSLVHIKAWHGLTALHRACLGGDYNTVHLLLRAGADPNSPTNNGETSTMFACRRGNPSILNLILEYKGDISVIDRQGRSAMHYAAESGNVCMLHYLHTVYDLDFKVIDVKLQTPFHIVCTHGHMDAFKYLIQKDRCDLMKVNIEGDTPVHILAKEGHSHLCWLLLCILGCSPLHEVNNAGFYPKDLAEQRDRPGHREITPILEHFYNESSSNNNLPVKGPVLLWYWMLLMPAVVYSISVLLSHLVPSMLHTPVIIIGVGYIIYDQSKHLHRLQHVCRWPNPMYAGVFGAGIIHTSIAYFKLVFWNMLDSTIILLFTPLLSFLLFYLYWKILTIDPGVVKKSDFDMQLKRELNLLDLCQPPRSVDDFCAQCEIVKPRLTKHCKLCKECYQDMDHHCLFLLRCVAGNNQLYFVWFILVCLLCMALFICLSILRFYRVYIDYSVLEALGEMLLKDAWLLTLILMNVLSILWGINLLRTQFNAISEGYTTYFKPHGHASLLTNWEKTMNSVYFMLGKPPYAIISGNQKLLNV